MTAVVWMLAGVARCASGAACPSDADLLAAVWQWDVARAVAVAEEAEARDEIVLVHPRKPKRVERVVCGDALGNGEDPAVACSMTVRYTDGASHQVAALTKGTDGWRATRVLAVWRRK